MEKGLISVYRCCKRFRPCNRSEISIFKSCPWWYCRKLSPLTLFPSQSLPNLIARRNSCISPWFMYRQDTHLQLVPMAGCTILKRIQKGARRHHGCVVYQISQFERQVHCVARVMSTAHVRVFFESFYTLFRYKSIIMHLSHLCCNVHFLLLLSMPLRRAARTVSYSTTFSVCNHQATTTSSTPRSFYFLYRHTLIRVHVDMAITDTLRKHLLACLTPCVQLS